MSPERTSASRSVAVRGALIGLWGNGGTLNLFSQIGIVMLIGLAAKNGILIVEFANQLRDEGRSVRDAVIEAVAQRAGAGFVDPALCEREPIHIPGSIQPNAVMLAADPETLALFALLLFGGLGLSWLHRYDKL